MLTSLGSQMAYFLVHLCKYIRTKQRQAKTLNTQLSTLQYSNPGEGILLVKKNASDNFVALVKTSEIKCLPKGWDLATLSFVSTLGPAFVFFSHTFSIMEGAQNLQAVFLTD